MSDFKCPVPASQYVSADDAGVALLIKYYPGVSSNTSATVAVVQDTSMTFQVGGAAYTGFELPVSGALGGIIDLTNAAAATLGQVVDAINSTSETFATGFFRAVIVDGTRDDLANDFLAIGATQCTRADGLQINWDTSTNFAIGETRAVLPAGMRTDIRNYVTPAGKLIENPYFDQQTVVRWVEGYSTYGGGTSLLRIQTILAKNKSSGGSERVTTLWNESMGATGTNKQFTQFAYAHVYGGPHEKVIVRVVNDTAQATVILLVDGLRTTV